MSGSPLTGQYFDGRTSQPQPVELHFEPGAGLRLRGAGLDLSFAANDLCLTSRLGRTPRSIHLPEGQLCVVEDNDALDTALKTWRPGRARGWAFRLESSLPLAVVALVVTLVGMGLFFKYGLPAMVRKAAFAVPETLHRKIGGDALQTFDKFLFEPSRLPAERRAELEGKFRAMLAKIGDPTDYRLEFRSGKAIGANAFALPSGILVMTDELVALAQDDRELLAVLAHECGHVRGRHSLRMVLQSSLLAVALTFLTGDASSVATLGSALPTLLLESKFSRTFEEEADAYAIEAMRHGEIDPEYFATILQRLSSSHGEHDHGLGYLSSHPATKDRIEAVRRGAEPTETDK